jgi:DNA-binding MarR family transcriptional regulator
MEHLCDLLFEVSNEDRLRILTRLEKEAMNITSLSRELDITTQETSRHSSRLVEMSLTRKSPDNYHSLTQYGRLILRLLPGLEFVSRHREYFTTHAIAGLPQELLCRIGQLGDCSYINDVMVTIYNIEKVIREAEEYLMNMGSYYPASVIPLMQEALDRGVMTRSIDHKHKVPNPKMIDLYMDEDWVRVLRKARSDGRSVDRLLAEIPMGLWMSEKEIEYYPSVRRRVISTSSGSPRRTRKHAGGAGTFSSSSGSRANRDTGLCLRARSSNDIRRWEGTRARHNPQNPKYPNRAEIF